MTVVHPVILCGGSGTRLWPVSRKSYPKQFVPLLGEQTLFQACARRLAGQAGALSFAAPTILTHEDFRFIVAEQLQQAGVDPGAILIEPEARNTAPAVLAAALHLQAQDPRAVMLVAPSDHVIDDVERFHAALAGGVAHIADHGGLITFGIQPRAPETGYGYLQLAENAEPNEAAMPLRRFVEKPDLATARQMLADGNYLWNAGIFLFAARDIIAAFEEHAPELTELVRASVANARPDLGFLRLEAESWSAVDAISIDYAVMEKAANLSVVRYAGGWSDLGSWTAVQAQTGADERDVTCSGPAIAIDCQNSLLRAESDEQQLVGIGLDSIIAVAMPDAVLVADRRRAQDIKLAVSALRDKGAAQAETFPRDYRPWGWFERLVEGDRFQVKTIHVHPGAALSLQSHHHRAEHWIVVAGTARVTIGDRVELVSENQSVYVPLGVKHRLENPGKVAMVLIEVQTGSYLAEDDITRYEDVYARGV